MCYPKILCYVSIQSRFFNTGHNVVAPPIGRQRKATRPPVCSHLTFEGLQQETDQIRSFDSRETGPPDCPDLLVEESLRVESL